MYLCEVVIVSQLCISFPYVLHGLCEDYLTCDIAFNAVMPLSRASTRGRYNRIEGVTAALLNAVPVYFHFLKGFLINEVQSAASIHEYLGNWKPSTFGLRTNAAGARAVLNLGSSLALKVIAVSLHGFIVATW